MLPSEFITKVVAGVAVAALVAYALIVTFGLVYSVRGGNDPGWLTSEAMRYLSAGLASLVGGVVAAAFGVKQGNDGPNLTASTRAARNTRSLGRITLAGAGSDGYREAVGKAYVLVYLAWGFASCAVWVWKQGATLEMIGTLSSSFVALVLAIVGAWFSESPS